MRETCPIGLHLAELHGAEGSESPVSRAKLAQDPKELFGVGARHDGRRRERLDAAAVLVPELPGSLLVLCTAVSHRPALGTRWPDWHTGRALVGRLLFVVACAWWYDRAFAAAGVDGQTARRPTCNGHKGGPHKRSRQRESPWGVHRGVPRGRRTEG